MPTSLASATGLPQLMRALARRLLQGDLDRLQRQIDHLQARVEETTAVAARADRMAAQARGFLALNRAQQEDLARARELLVPEQIIAHVRDAILRAPLATDPFPHIVVEKLLPPDVYKLLLRAIPPAAFFGDHDPIKQNLRLPLDFGPELSVTVLGFFDAVIARQAIRPAVLDAFAQPLDAHYRALFGDALVSRAAALPQAVSGGRLMLRRPGYHLAAHRDPKRTMLTCLLYLATSSDKDTYGTHIYRVPDDREATYTQTYYPEQDGRRCELVRTVPYRPNSMLVFLNSGGAHGADIPADAPADLERYSYQFYVGPSPDDMDTLVAELPAARQALWRSKAASRQETAG